MKQRYRLIKMIVGLSQTGYSSLSLLSNADLNLCEGAWALHLTKRQMARPNSRWRSLVSLEGSGLLVQIWAICQTSLRQRCSFWALQAFSPLKSSAKLMVIAQCFCECFSISAGLGSCQLSGSASQWSLVQSSYPGAAGCVLRAAYFQLVPC